MSKLKPFLSAALFCTFIGGVRAQDLQPPAGPSTPVNVPQINPLQLPSLNRSAPALTNVPGGHGAPLALGTSVRLSATLSDSSPLLKDGVNWRVYSERADDAQGLTLVTETGDAQPQLRLPPGVYVINASFGRASVTRRLQISNVPIQDRFNLNAGGLSFSGAIGSRPIPEQKLTATIYAGPGPGGALIMDGAPGGRIVRLPAGDYHIVSHYGDANAVVEGDVRVQAGKVTMTTFNHRASEVMLKLVKERGGEALANTLWSIYTPGGDKVKETIGAFPTVVLEQGEYTAVAANDGRTFTQGFKVEPGKDLEMEVLRQ